MNRRQWERYPVKRNRFSSHSQIQELLGVGDGLALLDVGCARGHLSKMLQEMNWRVTGIEADSSEAAIALANGIDVRVGPAEIVLPSLGEKYDVIVFADVLEHMINPANVLALATSQLSSSGRMILSIPNVAHLSVRMQLLFGSFSYTERGILDRTHLRFFTRKSLIQLLSGSKLRLCQLRVTPAPIEEVFPVLGRHWLFGPFLILNAWLARLWKSGLAYQYIVVVEPTAGLPVERPGR